MTKFNLIVSLSFLLTTIAFGQNCNCENNFEWVKKTFEENDAGFQYVLDIKGNQAYENHNKLFQQKVKGIKQSAECTKLLYEWLTFFRAGHIAIRRLENNNSIFTKTIAELNKNWEAVNLSTSEFERYLNKKKENDYEGVWETEPYKIGIKKAGLSYVGFIIETSAENWKPGDVKLKFNDKKGTFFLRDKSAESFTNQM